jgi:hypothetical protein
MHHCVNSVEVDAHETRLEETDPAVPAAWLAACQCGAKLCHPLQLLRPRSPMLGTAFRSASDSLVPLSSRCPHPVPVPKQLGPTTTIDRPLPPASQPASPTTPRHAIRYGTRANMSNGVLPNGPSRTTHTPSQRYLSTRGDDSGVGTPLLLEIAPSRRPPQEKKHRADA